MNCILTKEDCKELYRALGCAHAANLQLTIGYDGEELAEGEANLNRSEAHTIYRALMNRREHIIRGAYDAYPDEVKTSGSFTFELLEHVESILAKIGDLGENLVTELSLKSA
jgi:hypothetical protein